MKKPLIMHRITCLILIWAAFFAQKSAAQEARFSQISRSVFGLNPSTTGYDMGDYYHRFAVATRTQWGSPWQNDAVQSYQASYDFRLCGGKQRFGARGRSKRQFKNNGTRQENLAFGIQGRRTHSNLADFTFSGLWLSAAYHQLLGENAMLSAGAGAGMLNYSIDPGPLTFNEQFDGAGFNAALNNMEDFIYDSRIQPDLQAGIMIHGEEFSAGLGLNHLNRPVFSFLGNDNHLAIAMTLHGSYSINLHDGINPPWVNLQAFYHGPFSGENNDQWLLIIGGRINYPVSRINNFRLGASLRLAPHETRSFLLDALTPSIQFDVASWSVCLSYDANLSRLRTTFTGGLELSASVAFGNRPKCPGICPWANMRH